MKIQSGQLMSQVGSFSMAFAVLFLLTVTMGQRKDEETKQWMSKRAINPVAPSSLFSNPPIPQSSLPIAPIPSRSRQGSDWMQDILWLKPLISGYSIAFSPNGQFIAVTTDGFGQVGIYQIADGKWVTFMEADRLATSVAFSPDGRFLASGHSDKTVKLWNVSDGGLVRTLTAHTSEVTSVAFSPDGQFLASGSKDKFVHIWKLSDGSLHQTLTGHTDAVSSVAFSVDNQFLASGSLDMTVKLWRVSDGSLVKTLTGHASSVSSVAFSPNGQFLASGSYDGSIKLWRVVDGSLERDLTTKASLVTSIAFSPDGQILASGSLDNTVKLWRVSDGSLVRTLTGHASGVASIAFSPDGQLLVSVSYDNTFRLWRISDGSLVRISDEHTYTVSSVSFSPNGQLLASGSQDKTVKIWRASDGELIRTLTGHRDGVSSVAFSPDGQLLASGSSDKTIKLWNVSDGSLARTLNGHTSEINSVTFSLDGKFLASGSDDKTIRVWNTLDGSLVRTIVTEESVNSVAFSPDGQFLASGEAFAVKIWRLSDGSLVKTLESSSYSVAFSPDGQLLASQGFGDYTIKLWQVSDWSLAGTLTGSTGSVMSLAFSHDGQFLASAELDGATKIWRISDGKLVKTLRGHSYLGLLWTFSVSFSPDGQFLASAGGGIAVWRLGTLAPNNPPSAPTLLSPSDNSTLTALPIQLKLSTTDPDHQRLRFKIEILQNGQVVQTFDQTKDTSGWDKAFYASGETATLTISQLPSGTYQWRAYAFDGIEWSPVSEVRNFVLKLQIQWTFYEPKGDVIQIPIFRMKADIAGLPSSARLHYRIEVSSDPQFKQQVLSFDQSVDPTMWSKTEYAPDEPAGFIARYAFPLYATLYWRARVKRVGENNWSEPSPSQSFQVMRGFSFTMPTRVRVGRIESIPVTVVNPYNEPIDLILAAKMSLNTDEFTGTAKVVAPDGRVIDEISFGQEEGYLEAFMRDLPPGTHTYTIQLQVTSTRHIGRTNERIIAPLLSFALDVMAGWALSFVIEKGCESIARAILGNNGFTPPEVNEEIDRMKGAAQDEIIDRGTKTAIGEMEKRGAGKVLKKFVKYYSPITSVISGIGDCVEGIRKAYGDTGGESEIVQSWDPNMKVGVVGREGFIQPWESLPYRVLFENVPPPPPAQPAPAQEVIITDVLDDEIDLSTFSFTSVGFGNRTFSVPVNSKTLSLDVDLRPEGKNIIVQIRGSLNETNRKVTVTFKGIDPDTGQLHPDGFLPPNQNLPEGEGWVAFEVRLKEDVQSGAQVKNKATIVFDVNPPMETNEVVVTVDREPPQSQVKEITGSRSLAGRQVSYVANSGRCIDCSVQNQGNIEVQFEASDDVSGVDTVALWVNEERVNFRGTRQVIIGERQYRHYSTLSGSAEPKFSFKGKFGYNYRFYTVASDVAGNKEAEPEDSDARITIGEPPTLPKGLHMVSVPVESEDVDPKPVFLFEGNKWARWNPEAKNGQGDYVLYDNDPTGFTKFVEPKEVPGRGYWVYLPEETIVQVYGELPDETKPFAIPLKKGWNMIGNLWLVALDWNLDEFKVRRNGEEKTLAQAHQAGWIEDYAWGWEQDANNPNEGRYVLVYDTSIISGVKGQLEPWKGYWVYAHTDCELILPPTSQGKGRGTRDRGQVVKGNGWSIRLQASVDGSVGEAVMGIASGTRGLAIGLPPDPPTGNNGVQVILLKNNVPLAVDVRSDGSRKQEWDVLVRFGTRDGGRGTSERKEVTLTFDGIGYAPKDVSAWLVDTVTGKRLYLRTQPSYRFVAQEGEVERKFKLIVERGNERPLRVIGLKATPMRGQGIVISFSLTKPAQVFVEVLTLTGRRIAVLEGSGSRVAGEQRRVWRGVNGGGLTVSSGAYLVRVTATDDEGRQVQGVTVVRIR